MSIPVNVNKLQGHIIPPTPGPRTINSLEDNARERFSGIVWITCAPDKKPSDYLSDYDFVEPYDEKKSYSKRMFTAAYEGRIHNYHSYLCIANMEDGQQYYVVAKRMPSDLAKLEPYCTCITCCSSTYNPLKYLWCPMCTRCIKAGPGIAAPEFVTRAEQAFTARQNASWKPTIWEQYFKPTTIIPIAEATVMLAAMTVVVLAIYLI
jgi:hypothetical protein